MASSRGIGNGHEDIGQQRAGDVARRIQRAEAKYPK
jgi:hypothetical protein